MWDWRHAGDVLLALDPRIDGLHVRPGGDVVLGQDVLLDAVDLCHDKELARVARQDLAAVLKLVLGVPAAAQADGRYDAVRDRAGAWVDGHSEQRDRGSVVGGESDELRRYGLAIFPPILWCAVRDMEALALP